MPDFLPCRQWECDDKKRLIDKKLVLGLVMVCKGLLREKAFHGFFQGKEQQHAKHTAGDHFPNRNGDVG